jgi:uncharacterized integral membrane protein (TIGR00697 family)
MNSNTYTTEPLSIPRIALIAIFITALITSQVTAAKIVAIGLPFELPLTGELLLVPAAAFAYAVTFFSSDCYAELYGRQSATQLVNVAFVMNFVLLGLIWLAISAPAFTESPVDQAQFSSVLGASAGVVVGSLVAYLISQNCDVILFHWIRDYTDGEALWLRNIGSTITSQLIDTVVFISISFIFFQGVPLSQAIGLIIGQYIIKLAIAAIDTPVVYATVGVIQNQRQEPAVTTGD